MRIWGLKQANIKSAGLRLLNIAAFIIAFTYSFWGICPSGGIVNAADYVNINSGEQSRSIRVGLNKTSIIRLPSPVRDILVSSPDHLDAIVRTATTTYLIGKKVGQTNVIFFNKAGKQVLILEVEVERDLETLRSLLDRVLPEAAIEVDSINNNVVLMGSVSSAEMSKKAIELASKFIEGDTKIVNMLKVSGKQQVLLKVKIAEVNRKATKELAIDLSTTFGSFGNTFVNLSSGLSGIASVARGKSGGFDANATIKALESNGLLRTLAEPNLTAVSGKEANFVAGGEFPIVVQDNNDDGGRYVVFKEYGVILKFTPVVLSNGRINLQIKTEVSSLAESSSFGVPGINSRKAETTVELPSGGSMALAGLLQEEVTQNISGMPGLKDLPILGALFRSNKFIRNETELVVIVTPYLVTPTSKHNLSDPAKGLIAASDASQNLMGRFNKIYGDGAVQGGAYHGNFGFDVE